VFPIAQVGAVPVLVDVDRDSYNINVEAIEEEITPRTRAIMPVHLLGNPCDMASVMAIARRRDLMVIEDACEAHGAEYHGQKVGSFGDLATFSFFFSHHISTIEGGMVTTNRMSSAEAVRSRRAFGWIRDLGDRDKLALAALYPAIDPRFLFLTDGYNFRPTEIQGAFGMHQLPRLEGYIAIRRDNMAYWNRELAEWEDWIMLPSEAPRTTHVSFAYAVTVKEGAPFTAKEFQAHLESCGVETRPIEAGDMSQQPAMKRIQWRAGGPFTNAAYIHHNGFFWGNSHGITHEQREAVVGYVDEFMRGF
jgi:CDP-6-deoxy-D-xylo-4-hexulose-3-dehydrase